jgi:hypothetical protein
VTVNIILITCRSQDVVQSAESTPNEAEVTSSNPHLPFYTDISKKKKKKLITHQLLKYKLLPDI